MENASLKRVLFCLLIGIFVWNTSLGTTYAEEKVYTIGTSGATKPLNYYDDKNNLVGLEVDILSEIDRRLDDVTFKYEITDYPSLFAGLEAGKFDLLSNNLGENENRREKFLLSQYPYVITHNVIITKTDQPDNLTLEDLKGKTMGVVPSSPQTLFLEEWNKQHPNQASELVYLDSDPATLIRDVYAGRLDATIYATTYLHDAEETYGIKLKAHPIENEEAIRIPGSYFIYRKEHQDIRDKMDKIMLELRQDGTLAKLSQKYLGQDDTHLSKELVERNQKFEQEAGRQPLEISKDLYGATDKQKNTATKTSKQKASNNTDGKLFDFQSIGQFLPLIFAKLPISLGLTLLSGVIGLVLGLALAFVKIKKIPVLQTLVMIWVSYLRGTPQLVQLFLAYYGLPLIMMWFNARTGNAMDISRIPAFYYAFIALGLNEAAYLSETIRSAILSVDKNEIEAAKSIGLTDAQAFKRIIAPSAMIVALPNFTNSMISLFKGTSLAFTITVIDMMGQAKIIGSSNLRFFEAYIAVSIIYWLVCIGIEFLGVRLEKHFNCDLNEVEIEEVRHV